MIKLQLHSIIHHEKTLTYIPPSVQNGEILVRPSIDMIREGSNRWNTTAVGYFLGKRPYFHHLNDFVRSIWPAVREVKATSNGFFFFQFKTVAAMEEVLEGGPWLYLGQPIVLQKWEPGRSTDAITRACTRLDFARVCVMLNVNSKLPKHIVIMMPNEHGGESACKVDVDFDLCEEKPNTCPALRTSDPIPNPNPISEHPEATDDMVSNERPHQRTDKGNQIVIYNAFDILRDADEDADESIRGPNTCNPWMFPHVEHNDLECSGTQQERSSGRRDLVSEFRLHFIALLETRVMPSNVCRVQTGLLPRWRWFVDYSGPGNRIWIAWNDDFIDVDILNIGTQFVHCRVHMHEIHEHILITVVYGANEVSARRELWQGLTELAVAADLPWLVGGDFNAVLDMSEVSGASGDIRVAMHDFNDCIIQTGLISLPMQGERFSWHNCSTDGRSLWKRLDRMLLMMHGWSNGRIFSIPALHHVPLITRRWWKGDSRDVQVSMFRFDNYLALSPGFLASVHNIWQHPVIGTPMYSVTRKLKALKPMFRQQRRKKGDLAMNVKLAAGFLEVAQILLQADRHNSLIAT
ncbi:UNVERIFIED_CONTAM: hypothetical protein Scaly_3072000 [Sesamum calycinum]|uniref:DUF4283 domain-containing protein n=1 Tax=Sesamum calycinum TaxID=2727403 RepID=A0AAW2JUU2_9LAMI